MKCLDFTGSALLEKGKGVKGKKQGSSYVLILIISTRQRKDTPLKWFWPARGLWLKQLPVRRRMEVLVKCWWLVLVVRYDWCRRLVSSLCWYIGSRFYHQYIGPVWQRLFLYSIGSDFALQPAASSYDLQHFYCSVTDCMFLSGVGNTDNLNCSHQKCCWATNTSTAMCMRVLGWFFSHF